MTQHLIWLHEDALRASHPVLEHYNRETDAIYIWDDAYLQTMNYGFQRLVFIYETLTELGIPVYRGKTADVLIEMAKLRHVEEIRMANTPNPALLKIRDELAKDIPVVTVSDHEFVTFDRPPKLKRFFGYWKAAAPQLLRE